MLRLMVDCPFCGKTSYVEVKQADFDAWEAGALAQDVFEYLTATEREILISGLCEDCQNNIFGVA